MKYYGGIEELAWKQMHLDPHLHTATAVHALVKEGLLCLQEYAAETTTAEWLKLEAVCRSDA